MVLYGETGRIDHSQFDPTVEHASREDLIPMLLDELAQEVPARRPLVNPNNDWAKLESISHQ
jgi:hypothetical protein